MHSWPRPRPPPLSLGAEQALLARAAGRELPTPIIAWWASWPSIVVGRTSREGRDYDCGEARARGLPVYRRPTGGGAVLHGPGVLAVTLIEAVDSRPGPLEVYRRGTRLLLGALRRLGIEASIANEGDIVVGGWKVGGSAAMIGSRAVLYHAIITLDEPLEGVEKLTPPRLDLVESGRVDPVKYRPRPLADLHDVTRGELVQAIAEEASEARIHGPLPSLLHLATGYWEYAEEYATSPRWRPCR